MTVEVEYEIPQGLSSMGDWQVRMAKQIESNRGFPLTDVERRLDRGGTRFIVSVETALPSQAVENMLADIEDFLPSNAVRVETREV